MKGATPTTTEKKIHKLYSLPESSDDSDEDKDSGSDDSCEEEEGVDFDQVPEGESLEGYRLIDMTIFSEVISQELACKVCGSNLGVCFSSKIDPFNLFCNDNFLIFKDNCMKLFVLFSSVPQLHLVTEIKDF